MEISTRASGTTRVVITVVLVGGSPGQNARCAWFIAWKSEAEVR